MGLYSLPILYETGNSDFMHTDLFHYRNEPSRLYRKKNQPNTTNKCLFILAFDYSHL